MIYGEGFMGLLLIALWVGCFIDVLLTPEGSCRNLPKLAWVFIVLLFSFIGSIAWLVAGRPWDKTGVAARTRGATSRFPEYDKPNRVRASNPDDDEEFLDGLRARAEEQRRRAREAREREQGGPADQT